VQISRAAFGGDRSVGGGDPAPPFRNAGGSCREWQWRFALIALRLSTRLSLHSCIDRTADGAVSRFHKLVSRRTPERRRLRP